MFMHITHTRWKDQLVMHEHLTQKGYDQWQIKKKKGKKIKAETEHLQPQPSSHENKNTENCLYKAREK